MRGGLAALALLAAACQRPAAPGAASLGGWDVERATLRQVTDGRCDPTTLTDGRGAVWCYALPGPRMGSGAAKVDVYFSAGGAAGSAVGSAANLDAPLIELQLSVPVCRAVEVDRYLRDRLGNPVASGRGHAYWETGAMLVAAALPDRDGSCLVRAFPRRERAEYDKVKAAAPPP
jgi:hypothetical protein